MRSFWGSFFSLHFHHKENAWHAHNSSCTGAFRVGSGSAIKSKYFLFAFFFCKHSIWSVLFYRYIMCAFGFFTLRNTNHRLTSPLPVQFCVSIRLIRGFVSVCGVFSAKGHNFLPYEIFIRAWNTSYAFSFRNLRRRESQGIEWQVFSHWIVVSIIFLSLLLLQVEIITLHWDRRGCDLNTFTIRLF